jgi:hypothetical protein
MHTEIVVTWGLLPWRCVQPGYVVVVSSRQTLRVVVVKCPFDGRKVPVRRLENALSAVENWQFAYVAGVSQVGWREFVKKACKAPAS